MKYYLRSQDFNEISILSHEILVLINKLMQIKLSNE
jgi:hypothetical protein